MNRPPDEEPRGGGLRIAGLAAAWTEIVLDVEDEDGRLDAPPLRLLALADAEASIDAGALLREAVIEDPPYWALVWTGARAIAARLAAFPIDERSRVLDLGCGLGLSGLAAAARGAKVVFGDYLEEPLEFVRASLEGRGFEGCEVKHVDFTRSEDHGHFDLILAADIVYDPAHYQPLAAFLDRHVAEGGCILLTESLRADARVFLEGLEKRGFQDNRRALWVMEDGRRERTWLHELRRAAR